MSPWEHGNKQPHRLINKRGSVKISLLIGAIETGGEGRAAVCVPGVKGTHSMLHRGAGVKSDQQRGNCVGLKPSDNKICVNSDFAGLIRSLRPV